VTRAPIRRLFGLVCVALLAVIAVGVGPAGAAQPAWKFVNVEKLPATVSENAVAGYSFRILNDGSSNISKLFLTDSFVGAPVFFWNSRGTVCQTSPDLRCDFGALIAGDWIDVKIAYRVGTADFSTTFRLDSSGDPAGKNNSHGDAKLQSVTTDVTNDPDFAGSFTLDTTSLANNPTLGRSNKQATSIDPPESLIPVTIEDHITTGVPCTIADCSNVFGEWSTVSVAGGKTYGAPFKVTLFVWGGAVPGGASTGEVQVLHTTDLGTTYAISQACTPATGTPTNAECLTVTKVGSNYRIVVWLFQNGFIRGGI
jgi:hypothetical protein